MLGCWQRIAAAFACGWCVGAAADELESPLEAATLGEAVREGELLFQIRPRYTWAEQDGRPQNAHWASVRTRLGWKTLEYRGFSALVEGINVARFAAGGYLLYQDTPASSNGVGFAPGSYTPGFYPLIADPNTTAFNRLYLDYAGLPHTLMRAGRQLVRIDNQRFIGDYDSAQLPQSFTGLTFENTSVAGLRLMYGYFTHVRNSYGVQWDTSTSAFNARYEVAPLLKIAGYAYLQNQPITGSVTGFTDNSNKIFGGRVWGGWQVTDALELLYSAELAEQRDYAGGNSLIDAPYRRLGVGAATARGYLRVDWELLGSNGGLVRISDAARRHAAVHRIHQRVRHHPLARPAGSAREPRSKSGGRQRCASSITAFSPTSRVGTSVKSGTSA